MKGRWNYAEIKVYKGGWFTFEDYGLKVRIKSGSRICITHFQAECLQTPHLCSIRQAVIRMSINVKTAPLRFLEAASFLSRTHSF